MSALVRKIDQSVLAVLSAGRCDGPRFFLQGAQLGRKLYDSTNKVLDALGGKWNRSAKAHVFGEDCEPLIEGAIETGSYARPSDMGWFPTPEILAHRIATMAGVSYADYPGPLRVLEPSAGLGAIADKVSSDCEVVAVEIDAKRAEVLAQLVDGIHVGDFLQVAPDPTFDRVVMNPPFAKRADIHHVLHARKFLKTGGRLVAIMSAGIAFREDRLTQDFRALCDSIEALPEDSFKASGASVNTVVVTMGAAA